MCVYRGAISGKCYVLRVKWMMFRNACAPRKLLPARRASLISSLPSKIHASSEIFPRFVLLNPSPSPSLSRIAIEIWFMRQHLIRTSDQGPKADDFVCGRSLNLRAMWVRIYKCIMIFEHWMLSVTLLSVLIHRGTSFCRFPTHCCRSANLNSLINAPELYVVHFKLMTH